VVGWNLGVFSWPLISKEHPKKNKYGEKFYLAAVNLDVNIVVSVLPALFLIAFAGIVTMNVLPEFQPLLRL